MEKQTDKNVIETHGGAFGIGEPNVNFAKYFIGNSYLKQLAKTENGIGFANVTFEPKCRNNWHIHKAEKDGGQVLICVDRRRMVSRRRKTSTKFKSRRYCCNSSKCKTLAWCKKRFLV